MSAHVTLAARHKAARTADELREVERQYRLLIKQDFDRGDVSQMLALWTGLERVYAQLGNHTSAASCREARRRFEPEPTAADIAAAEAGVAAYFGGMRVGSSADHIVELTMHGAAAVPFITRRLDEDYFWLGPSPTERMRGWPENQVDALWALAELPPLESTLAVLERRIWQHLPSRNNSCAMVIVPTAIKALGLLVAGRRQWIRFLDEVAGAAEGKQLEAVGFARDKVMGVS